MGDSNQIGQLISKAMSDEKFKKRLLSDTAAVLKENGVTVPAGMEIKVVENTDKVFHLVIPQSSGELSQKELDKAAGGMVDPFAKRRQ